MFRVASRANTMIPRATIHVTSIELVTGSGPMENTFVAAGGKPSGCATCAAAAESAAAAANRSAARPGSVANNIIIANNTDLIKKEVGKLPHRVFFHKDFPPDCETARIISPDISHPPQKSERAQGGAALHNPGLRIFLNRETRETREKSRPFPPKQIGVRVFRVVRGSVSFLYWEY